MWVASACAATSREHDALLDALPPGVEAAWAYGSGAVAQPGHADAVPVRDYLLCVEAPRRWHAANVARNRAHYGGSLVALAGGEAVASLAEAAGVGAHFNAYVTAVPGAAPVVKYGVVATEVLRDDLTSWTSLFFAGRLQKPVVGVREAPTAVAEAQATNLRAALACALLQLPSEFTESELHEALVGLSYTGDVRTSLGAEDRFKVRRIADGSRDGLRKLYADALARQRGIVELGGSGRGEQDVSPAAKRGLLTDIPAGVAGRIALGRDGAPVGPAAVAAAIAAVVGPASLRQALAGALAAGSRTAAKYAWQKVVKAVGSRL